MHICFFVQLSLPFTICVSHLLFFLSVSMMFPVSVETIAKAKNKPQPEKAILDHILYGYDKDVRPDGDFPGLPAYVTLHLNLRRIVKMDVKTQVLTTYMWVTRQWVDTRLRWNPDFANITEISIPLTEIWTPELELDTSYSENDRFSLSDGFTLAVIKFDGDVEWKEPKTLRTLCPVDVTYFPFDQQICDLKILYRTNDGFDISFYSSTEELEVHAFANLSSIWTIVNTTTVRSYEYDETRPEHRAYITTTIVLQRRPQRYVYSIILPWTMLSIINALILTLALDSPIRLAVQIFNLTAFSMVMSWDVISVLPSTSNSTPLILIYMIVMVILSGLSVICTIGIVKVFNHGKHPDSRPLPQWLRWSVSRKHYFVQRSKINVFSGDTGSGVVTTPRDDIPLTQYSNVVPPDPFERSVGAGSKPRERMTGHLEHTSMSATSQHDGSINFRTPRQQKDWYLVAEEWSLLAIKLDAICFRVFVISIMLVNLSLITLTL